VKSKSGRNGGARPGAGRPKGSKGKPTLLREAETAALRQQVFEHREKLVKAQIANAMGIKHLLIRDPRSGRFERVAKDIDSRKLSAEQIDKALASGEMIEIWTKDPSIAAFTDLFNRALGKPIEQVELDTTAEIRIKWQD